ncbi:fimbrial protein [Ewingella allii]|uniref:fimbrial protein n=1 Tax=Ewingella allii TaxID=3092550 RepID=UPI003789343A
MKKLSVALAMLWSVACSTVHAENEIGQILFTGKVTSSSCIIDSVGTTSVINYDHVSIFYILYQNTTSPIVSRPFDIKLISCPPDVPIKVRFEGAYDAESKTFKDSSGKNISAAIVDKGSYSKIEADKFVTKTTSTSGVNILNYWVTLNRWKNAEVEPGDFSIVINYTMSYE